MRFDQAGRRLVSELATDPDTVSSAKAWWQLAYAHSAPIEGGEAI